MQYVEKIQDSALTSSQMVKLLSWFPSAESCTLGCRGVEEGRPCWVEQHHLLQLGVVIHGGVREVEGVRDLEAGQKHLGLGCSHSVRNLEAGVSARLCARVCTRMKSIEREQERGAQVEEITGGPSGKRRVKMLLLLLLLLWLDSWLCSVSWCLLYLFPVCPLSNREEKIQFSDQNRWQKPKVSFLLIPRNWWKNIKFWGASDVIIHGPN